MLERVAHLNAITAVLDMLDPDELADMWMSYPHANGCSVAEHRSQ